MEATGWKVDGVLRAIHQLLNDTPARREHYEKIVGTDAPKPLKYCQTRWVENVPVLERALEVLPHMSAYARSVNDKVCPNPDTKSFDVVKEAVGDPLMTAKLNFVLSVCREVTPFLKDYQTDKPKVTFLAKDLHKVE